MIDTYAQTFGRAMRSKFFFIDHDETLTMQAHRLADRQARSPAIFQFPYGEALEEKLNRWKSAFDAPKDLLGAMSRYVVLDSWTTLGENILGSVFLAAEWNYRFESKHPSWDIRMQVVRNMGIEPSDAVYVAIKRAVPKRSTLLTVDYSEVEKRLLAYYYGMSEPRSRKEFEDLYLCKYSEPEARPPQHPFYGTVTGRFSSRDIPPFSERSRDWRPNPRGRRY